MNYIPDIKDFFVGYECEMKNSSDPLYFDWEPVVFLEDFDFKSGTSLNDYDFAFLRGDLEEGNIRTPYLTREQLEKEGWGFGKEEAGYHPVTRLYRKGGDEAKRMGWSFVSDGYNVTYELILTTKEVPFIIINEHKVGGFTGNQHEERILFRGNCKSINEYRKIVEYLDIVKYFNL